MMMMMMMMLRNAFATGFEKENERKWKKKKEI